MLAGVAVMVASTVVKGFINYDLGRNATIVIELAVGLAVGMAAQTARRAHAELEQAARLAASLEERERLSRQVHDGAIQVLALVSRRGREIGGETAELAELAGEQERALRRLVSSVDAEPRAGAMTDVGALLRRRASDRVSVSVPADPVLLDADVADELYAAVANALDNVASHAGPDAHAYVLLEDLGDSVTVSIRDDGVGIADGRLEEAVARGPRRCSEIDCGTDELAGRQRQAEYRPGLRDGMGADRAATEWDAPTVMVVDDHPIWRDAVARDLAEDGFTVVATADGVAVGPAPGRRRAPRRGGDGHAAVPTATARRPPREVLAVSPSSRILVLSASDERDDVLEAVKAGATGYLVKSASKQELGDAVRATAEGRRCSPRAWPGWCWGSTGASPRHARRRPWRRPSLTERETEVLRHVAKGLTAKQIADRLSLSHRTVENHVQATFRKLQVGQPRRAGPLRDRTRPGRIGRVVLLIRNPAGLLRRWRHDRTASRRHRPAFRGFRRDLGVHGPGVQRPDRVGPAAVRAPRTRRGCAVLAAVPPQYAAAAAPAAAVPAARPLLPLLHRPWRPSRGAAADRAAPRHGRRARKAGSARCWPSPASRSR